MTENEEKSIQACLRFYQQWRELTIETDAQWDEFAKSVWKLAEELEKVRCPIGQHMLEAVLDSINDLYKDGMKPVQVNFFGRDDL